MDAAYLKRVEAEREFYDGCEEVHELPEIFHYWSNKYLKPQLQRHGYDGPDDLFLKNLKGTSFVSLGSGNCDLEVKLALGLRGMGREEFILECVDLNPVMLERGRVAAEAAGVGRWMRFVEGDFNDWNPSTEYDVVMANQALHHVVELEKLFDEVARSLKPTGRFVISDMIGRNGHQRWPNALEMIWEFWRELPPSYRYNLKFRCYEELFENRDYSTSGFEGIRAEDILPLLVDRFDFEYFHGFGNLVDPFTDRAFGPHFDIHRDWDRHFIDRVHRRDEEAILAGVIAPTHLVAVMGGDGEGYANVGPRVCLASRTVRVAARPENAYAMEREPELVETCRMLAEASAQNVEFRDWIVRLGEEVEQQSEWGVGLSEELDTQSARVLQLQAEVLERNEWAAQLEAELAKRDASLRQLQVEFEERTAWALQLDQEVESLRQRIGGHANT